MDFVVSGSDSAAGLAGSVEGVPAVVRVASAFAGSACRGVKPRKLGSSASPLPAHPAAVSRGDEVCGPTLRIVRRGGSSQTGALTGMA